MATHGSWSLAGLQYKKTSLDSHLMWSSPRLLCILPKEDIDRWDIRSRSSPSFTQNRKVGV